MNSDVTLPALENDNWIYYTLTILTLQITIYN